MKSTTEIVKINRGRFMSTSKTRARAAALFLIVAGLEAAGTVEINSLLRIKKIATIVTAQKTAGKKRNVA